MARTLVSAILLFVAAPCWIAPAASAEAAWDACLKNPTRDCVFSEALRVAQSVKDAPTKANSLALVAAAQAKAGLAAQAAANLQLATQAAASVDGNQRDGVLSSLAIAQVEAGKFADALQILPSIKAGQPRIRALNRLAAAQKKAGLAGEAAASFDLAIGAARSFKQDELVSALVSVAGAQAQVGLSNEAAATFALAALAAQDPDTHHNMLSIIARAQAEAGQIADALQVAQSEEESSRWLALEPVAEAQAKAGEIAQALHVAQDIQYVPAHVRAFGAIAAAEAKAGSRETAALLLQQAEELAKTAPTEASHAGALAAVAEAWAEAGFGKESGADFGQSLQIIQSMADASDRNLTIMQVAPGLAKSGKYSEAIELAHSMTNVAIRASTFARIVGDFEKAGKFPEALQAAQSIEDEGWRAAALSDIASKLPN